MSTSSIVGIAGLGVAALVFVITLIAMFPWRLRSTITAVLEAARLPAGATGPAPVDLEEVVYQIFRFRMVLLGSLFAFCLLLMVCSTVILVSGEAVSAEQARKKAETESALVAEEQEPDSGTEYLVAKPVAPTAQPAAAEVAAKEAGKAPQEAQAAPAKQP